MIAQNLMISIFLIYFTIIYLQTRFQNGPRRTEGARPDLRRLRANRPRPAPTHARARRRFAAIRVPAGRPASSKQDRVTDWIKRD